MIFTLTGVQSQSECIFCAARLLQYVTLGVILARQVSLLACSVIESQRTKTKEIRGDGRGRGNDYSQREAGKSVPVLMLEFSFEHEEANASPSAAVWWLIRQDANYKND